MRKLFLILSLVYLTTSIGYAQNFLIGASSGFRYLMSNQKGYSSAASVPLNFRVGGGLQALQFGAEFSYQLVKPTYIFNDPFLAGGSERFREEYKETDITGFIRLSTQKDGDGSAFYFINNFGVNLTSKSVSRPDIGEFANIGYKPSLLFKSGIGGSIALGSPIHLDIEFQYGLNLGRTEEVSKEIEDIVTSKYMTHGFGIHIGLSYTFL